jgi:hypothetical protein
LHELFSFLDNISLVIQKLFMAQPISSNPVFSLAAKGKQPAFCLTQKKSSMDVVDQLSRMALAHQTPWFGVIPKQAEESVFPIAEHPIFDPEKTAPMSNSGLVFSESNLGYSASANSRFFNLFGYKWGIFSDIIQKFTHHKDTLEERCYILGLSILNCQDLPYRLHCPNLNVDFFHERVGQEMLHPGTLSKLEIYKGLLQKEAWDQLFDAMGILEADIILEEWLGPIRPTVFKKLVSESSIAGVALRTFLRLDIHPIIRIRSKEDLEEWEKLCHLAKESLKQKIIESLRSLNVPPLPLLQSSQTTDKESDVSLDALISHVQEIEVARELLPSIVSDTESNPLHYKAWYERVIAELPHRLSCPNAKVSIGFSPYPGYPGDYPNR